MAYTKQTWVDGPGGGTPITATRLLHMEDGIEEGADSSVPGHTHLSSDVTDAISLSQMPPGSRIHVVKAAGVYGAAGSWPTQRPTSRADIYITWEGSTDPDDLALDFDHWDIR